MSQFLDKANRTFFEQIRLAILKNRSEWNIFPQDSNFNGGNCATKIVSIEDAGMATVYDLYEPNSRPIELLPMELCPPIVVSNGLDRTRTAVLVR